MSSFPRHENRLSRLHCLFCIPPTVPLRSCLLVVLGKIPATARELYAVHIHYRIGVDVEWVFTSIFIITDLIVRYLRSIAIILSYTKIVKVRLSKHRDKISQQPLSSSKTILLLSQAVYCIIGRRKCILFLVPLKSTLMVCFSSLDCVFKLLSCTSSVPPCYL